MPAPTEVFDLLYGHAAGEGREAVLFGTSVEWARPAFRGLLTGGEFPITYLEFPLLGSPRFDMLTGYQRLPKGSRFPEGSGFDSRALTDWFSSVPEELGAGFGFEIDHDRRAAGTTGVYLQFRGNRELIAPFLASVGAEERCRDSLSLCGKMPEGWSIAYIGLFPGRPGTPVRLGGYLSPREQRALSLDENLLERRFRQIGFTRFNGEMLNNCRELIGLAPGVDFQFDLERNGALGSTFGLSLDCSRVRAREAAAWMGEGPGGRMMETIRRMGLADSRWRRIAGAVLEKGVFVRQGEKILPYAMAVRMNYAKVPFRDAKALPAKFYLLMQAGALVKGK